MYEQYDVEGFEFTCKNCQSKDVTARYDPGPWGTDPAEMSIACNRCLSEWNALGDRVRYTAIEQPIREALKDLLDAYNEARITPKLLDKAWGALNVTNKGTDDA